MSGESFELDEVVRVAHTENAILVRLIDVDEEDAVEGEDMWWIPNSQIEATDLYEDGDEGYVEIPMWLARDKGME